jgi:Thioredoxin like C-terminal domain
VSAPLHLPSLGGATEWLNSKPLGPAELRGRVVLVNFCLTCIDWLRQEPYVRAWSQSSFEHKIDRVRVATKERGIDYPVAVDNDLEIWNAFANHYWPALSFVDADSVIRDQHFGEGRYLGHGRGGSAASLDELSVNNRAISREWTIGREDVPLDRGGGSIAVRFHARDAHLVLSSGAREPIRFRLFVDGEAQGPSHGGDVDPDGNGLVQDGRLYQLVRQRDAVRERTLEITFLEPGAEAYSFTFG